MKQTRIIMGMPVTVEIVEDVDPEIMDRVFNYFMSIDEKFSTYKEHSEISRINRREIPPDEYSEEMKTVFELSEQTKKESLGYFDVKNPDGNYDPSGLVKGWAINIAAEMLKKAGVKEYYVEAGGDIQTAGKIWKIGIRNPFNQKEIIKVLHLHGQGVATSGTYERGDHIYNPHKKGQNIEEIVSLTVIGPDVYEADRFATAAFAMSRKALPFIEKLSGLEGYTVDINGLSAQTSGFGKYL